MLIVSLRKRRGIPPQQQNTLCGQQGKLVGMFRRTWGPSGCLSPAHVGPLVGTQSDVVRGHLSCSQGHLWAMQAASAVGLRLHHVLRYTSSKGKPRAAGVSSRKDLGYPHNCCHQIVNLRWGKKQDWANAALELFFSSHQG